MVWRTRNPCLGKHNLLRSSTTFCVIDHALKIDNNNGLIPDHPGIVTDRQLGYIACLAFKLSSIVQYDFDNTCQVILKVWRFTTFRLGRGRPGSF
jgi:hypothetical protein